MQHVAFLIAVSLIMVLGACATTDSPEGTGQGVSSAALQHNQEGMKHYKMGHWDIAKQHFEAASKADPGLAEPHYNLGLVLHKMGAHDEATARFKKAGELATNNSAITG